MRMVRPVELMLLWTDLTPRESAILLPVVTVSLRVLSRVFFLLLTADCLRLCTALPCKVPVDGFFAAAKIIDYF